MENDRWRRCRPLHRKQILYPVPVHRPGLQAHEKAHGGHHRCPIERSHAGKDSAVGESAGERPLPKDGGERPRPVERRPERVQALRDAADHAAK